MWLQKASFAEHIETALGNCVYTLLSSPNQWILVKGVNGGIEKAAK